jgi:hypothetical protein
MSSDLDLLRTISRLEAEIERMKTFEVPKRYGGWTYLSSPLTSTSWDGDSYSTTTKTLIDLSAVFVGVPAGVKAVLVRIFVSDTSSSTATTYGYYMVLGPNAMAGSGDFGASPNGNPNGVYSYSQGVVTCDANGDIYYQIAASGVGSFSVHMQIWGYLQ